MMNSMSKDKKKTTARKISKVPTRIYSYRTAIPATEAPRVEDQYRLAAQYRNALVEIEHRLRERIREVQLGHPTIGLALILFQDAQGGVDDAYDDLRAAKNGTADPDLTEPRERLEMAKELRSITIDALRESKRSSEDLAKLHGEAKKAKKVAAKKAKTAERAAMKKKPAAENLAAVATTLAGEAEVTGETYETARRAAEPADVALIEAYAAVRERMAADRLAARHDYSGRGLRHGAYARVEDSVRRAAASTKRPLEFRRYDGSGSIGTQLTSDEDEDEDERVMGMTLRELVSAADPRVRLGPPGAMDKHPRTEVTACASWDDAMRLGRNLRRHAARTWIDLRVGSNPDRSPIFARFPVTLHRLPPKDSVIKWAHVVRRRVGHRLEWRFQFTLESKTFEGSPVAIGEGTCAINVGWRRLIDDQGEVVDLRAAYIVDEKGKEREICVPDYVTSRGAGKERRARGNHKKTVKPLLGAIGKCDDLAHIRDQALERSQFTLSAWLAERGGAPVEWQVAEAARPDGTVPRPMADRLRGYSAWRAAWKLRRFVDSWKTRRVPSDEAIFASLTAWAKQDRHLETWQASSRDRLIARRRETWRVIAAELARRYATILIGESKLTQIDGWERAAPEDGDPSDGRDQRRMARVAAPGELIAEIVKAAHKTGAKVRRVNEAFATQTCAACGHDEPWDAAPSIQHTCGGCGATWDQDANHCRNLLAREGLASGGAPRVGAEVLAGSSSAKARGNSGSAASAVLAEER